MSVICLAATIKYQLQQKKKSMISSLSHNDSHQSSLENSYFLLELKAF